MCVCVCVCVFVRKTYMQFNSNKRAYRPFFLYYRTKGNCHPARVTH